MPWVDRLVRCVTHPHLSIRFGSLLAAAAVIFVVGWSLAYLLLPEGVLSGRTGSAVLAGEQSAGTFYLEWLRILAINLAVATAVFVLPNLLRTRRGVPLGNIAVLVMVMVAAMVTGTNSFSVQVGTGGQLAPSVEILRHPGPYELAAYVLATTSAYGIGRWQLHGRWPHSTATRLPRQLLPHGEIWPSLAAAALVLAATTAWEARNIINAVG